MFGIKGINACSRKSIEKLGLRERGQVEISEIRQKDNNNNSIKELHDNYTEKLSPHPQEREAFGLTK